MGTLVAVLASLIGLEALTFVLAPEAAKNAVASLTPGELRIAGIIELAVAGAALYFWATG